MAPYSSQHAPAASQGAHSSSPGVSPFNDAELLPNVSLAQQKYFPGKGMRPRSIDDPKKPYEIDWIVAPVLIISPFMALWGIWNVPLQFPTLVLTLVLAFFTGLGITAGYHRLWSHKTYDASWSLELFLAIVSGFAMEGSARWWCRNHRAHHKFTDTPKDPYNVRKSLFWAHLGWMLVKQDKSEVGAADISDLNANKILIWQHRYYPHLVVAGVILPTLVAGLGWGDWMGGYFYAVICRLVYVHHSTFFVNSLAHYLGAQHYSDMHSAFDSFITALLSLGEGYHNYHHEFPQDYRNGIQWYHYDPTKWFITACYHLGQATNLKWIDENEIAKAKVQVQQAKLDEQRVIIAHGRSLSQGLPTMTWDDIRAETKDNRRVLVVVAGKVYDATQFVDIHPGGRQTLMKQNGRDVTAIFRGDTGEHMHTKFAISTLKRMVVGSLQESN